MAKFLLVLISIIAGIFECLFIPVNLGIKILLFIILIAVNIILEIGLFFLVMFILGLPINTKKEVEHYSKFYRNVLYFATKSCLSLFGIKTITEGFEKIPQDTNFVIVYNHLSNLDTMIMDVYLHQYPLVFVAKKSLFKIPFFGKMIHKIGYIKLDRGNIRQELTAIHKGIAFLNNNECSVGVSPEGTRNFTDEILLPFKVGCLHLVTETKRPIVVSTIVGTNEVKKNLFFKRHIVKFKILDVIKYEDYQYLKRNEISAMIRDIMLDDLTKNK